MRDKLVAGELDAAPHSLRLLYGLELCIAGKPQQMANLMTLIKRPGDYAFQRSGGEGRTRP